MLSLVRRLPWQAKEAVFITALMTVLSVVFPDDAYAFAVLAIILSFAIDDLCKTALRIAIKKRAVGQAKEDEHFYVILPRCRYKLLVLRQVLVLGGAKLARARRLARKSQKDDS
ncbi:hypothetical protein [Paraburkholderia fungorum]|uniref:Uncharacterized protein n=1 Tax=Paraburkholderia fungorum TaxID=134537 RepID=A0AAW3V222_9BURK|nr:hypothetical protein [Paraburkholderia fungorum]MBB4517362.1 hypothetical protein [Paraburkholderia fungorum]MBB6204431.1 hypothetical protein [Paraburkholderia fungorum]